MTTPDDDLEHCLWALTTAVDRYERSVRETIDDPDLPRRRYAAIGEVLMWAAALDDIDRNEPGRIPGYAAARAEAADLLDGMRYARNRVAHRIARAADQRVEDVFTDTFEETFSHVTWVWRSVADLPQPPPGKRYEYERTVRRPAYERHWQGRDVGPILRDVRDYFTRTIGRTDD